MSHFDMLPAQPADAGPNLCPERTLHGVVDCRTPETIGSIIEKGQQECEDLSPRCSARAEHGRPVLAEGAHKEVLAQPSNPQVPQQLQPGRANKHKHERDGNPSGVQAQKPAGNQDGQKSDQLDQLKQYHPKQDQEKHSDV